MNVEGIITIAQANAARHLLGAALRSVAKHGTDEDGNEYDSIDDIEAVIAALGECDRIVITDEVPE